MIEDIFEDENGRQDDASWGLRADDAGLYRRILAVVEDIPAMWLAFRHAMQLALRHDAALHLLSMPSVPMLAGMPDMLVNADKLLNEVAFQVEGQLEWLLQRAIHAGVLCHTHLRWGYSATTILRMADDIRCDLIIMGAPPPNPWHRVLQPNAARRVSSHARQPVLVIKASTSLSDSLLF